MHTFYFRAWDPINKRYLPYGKDHGFALNGEFVTNGGFFNDFGLNTEQYLSLEFEQRVELPDGLVEGGGYVFVGDIVLITDKSMERHFENDGIICKELVVREFEVIWTGTKLGLMTRNLYLPKPIIFDIPLSDVIYKVIGNIHEGVRDEEVRTDVII